MIYLVDQKIVQQHPFFFGCSAYCPFSKGLDPSRSPSLCIVSIKLPLSSSLSVVADFDLLSITGASGLEAFIDDFLKLVFGL